MGTMTHLVWRQLIKEKARTFTTILAMAVAATLTVATLIGINSARHSMYQDNIQNTGGLQFVLSKVNQETALAIQKKADISESVRYQQQGQISFADQVPNQPDSPLLMLPKPALQRLIQPILLEGRLPQNEQEVMLAQDLISDVYAVGKTVAAQRNGQRVVLKIVGSYRGYAGLMASDGAVTTGHFDGTKNYAVAAAFGNYGNFYAKLKKLTAQYHVGSDQQRMNELALERAGESRDVKVRAMFVLLVIVVLSVIGLVSLALIYTSINLSVQAQTQRYGLLRSIGATPRQIRQSVYLQALTLVLPAILLGLLAGIGGLSLAFHELNRIFKASGNTFQLLLTISWWPILVSGFFMLLVTLLAARRPAKRAAQVSPIAAARAQSASRKVSQRMLRQGMLGRFLPTPIAKLAYKHYRRLGWSKVTMMTTLALSLMIFIGFTSFFRGMLTFSDETISRQADVTITKTQSLASANFSFNPRRLPGVKRGTVTGTTQVGLKNAPQAFHDRLNVIVVSDQTFGTVFKDQPTIITGSRLVTSSKTGKRQQQWDTPKDFAGTLELANEQSSQKTLTQPMKVVTKTAAEMTDWLVSDQSGLVLSASRFRQISQALQIKNDDITYAIQVLLIKPSFHETVASALRHELPHAALFDQIENDARGSSFQLAIQVMVYGFLTLLTLVSLANIVNHIFANLLQRRRSLAMLQSVGTTPGQIVRMLALENGFLFGTSMVIGSLLGTLLGWILHQAVNTGITMAFQVPWLEMGMAGLALLAIWGIFAGISFQIMRHQDIDQLIRVG